MVVCPSNVPADEEGGSGASDAGDDDGAGAGGDDETLAPEYQYLGQQDGRRQGDTQVCGCLLVALGGGACFVG